MLYYKIVVTLAVLMFTVDAAFCKELFSYKGIQVSLADGGQCEVNTQIRLDADSEDIIRKSRIDMQELSDITKTTVWLDCEHVESISYKGYVENAEGPIYHAVARKDDKWFLNEQDPNTSLPEQTLPKNEISQPPMDKSHAQAGSQAQLEDKVARGDTEAKLELAKGLLKLSGADQNIQFESDSQRGIAILEQLASQGNQDAKHLLGEAYNADTSLDVNKPLLSSLSKNIPIDPDNHRDALAGQLALEAATQGSQEAITALNVAGKLGSGIAYYSLALMYFSRKGMPMGMNFLVNQLGLQLGAFNLSALSHAHVGHHFMRLSAQMGNNMAQDILRDLGEDIESTNQGRPLSVTDNHLVNALESMSNARARNTVEDILASATDKGSRSEARATSQPAGGGDPSMGRQEKEKAGSGSKGSTSAVTTSTQKDGGYVVEDMPQSNKKGGSATVDQNTQAKPIEIPD